MTLPQSRTVLTSYDLLKTFAVITMIIDHAGYFFFPEDPTFRAIGRLCVPIWFFLVGYAKSRNIGETMLIGAGILVLQNVFLGFPMLPFNVLVTIMLVRLCLDKVMQRGAGGLVLLAAIGMVMAVAVPTSDAFTEYGTLGLLLAMAGYMVRHENDGSANDGHANDGRANEGSASDAGGLIGRTWIVNLGVYFALGVFLLYQQYKFNFPMADLALMAAGSGAVIVALRFFRPREFVSALPMAATRLIQFCGRHTLAIYVAHLFLFKMIFIMTLPGTP